MNVHKTECRICSINDNPDTCPEFKFSVDAMTGDKRNGLPGDQR